ncbi:quaternary amine ABC transporter ATP-binding protein [Pseudomonas typographi]|uniref:quaternary amine ABC transporter ATP-binding protein n=1 Tax=Pseudomonas typographi TaxID=2715964 RepID=UPI00168674C3|nr:betaine/proline/choline family ABC transporter ATP-binding protein [Pseudomonas typographi]MBD1551861.1 betaine/proline/choline family ABC transporter ATP-binding protein [Pseudomonas typographi]MBD1587665.1 betaine/proline/choline family ABC transporter ATP-binding protein [Pseudomonas typographi]
MMANIVLEGVTKVFGNRPQQALQLLSEGLGKDEILERCGCVVGVADLSLHIAAGESFVIMGLSGSGKSTLVRHLNRLIDPTCGRILVDGQDVLQLAPKALREYRRHTVSMVFQSFALLPHKTVLANVGYGLHLRGDSPAHCTEQAMAWVDTVGLKGFEQAYPEQLSGGMRQRVGLARALAVDTDILLLDEAFSALDPLTRADMQDQLRALQQRLHKTIVFITHDLDEALRLGDRIAILRDGRLIQVGTPQDILTRPADGYVERFVQRRSAPVF